MYVYAYTGTAIVDNDLRSTYFLVFCFAKDHTVHINLVLVYSLTFWIQYILGRWLLHGLHSIRMSFHLILTKCTLYEKKDNKDTICKTKLKQKPTVMHISFTNRVQYNVRQNSGKTSLTHLMVAVWPSESECLAECVIIKQDSDKLNDYTLTSTWYVSISTKRPSSTLTDANYRQC